MQPQAAAEPAPSRSGPRRRPRHRPSSEAAPAEEAIAADLIRQFRAGHLDEARATFDRLHSDDDDPEARQRNAITFEFWRWRHGGDARGLDTLDSRRKDPEVGGLAERLIAEGHAEAGHSDLAVRHFERAIALSKRLDDVAAAVTGLAKSLTGLGRRNEAASLLSRWVNQDRDDDQRRQFVDELSGIYGEGEKWLYRAAALEVALESEPDNAARRFDAAFAYSQAGREDLALLHYHAALAADSDHRSAINNLGVAYERLGMGMKAVNEYKRAADLGESLGKANLGLSFLNAGFRAEAEAILYDAMQDPNAHDSVAAAPRLGPDQGRPGERARRGRAPLGGRATRLLPPCRSFVDRKLATAGRRRLDAWFLSVRRTHRRARRDRDDRVRRAKAPRSAHRPPHE